MADAANFIGGQAAGAAWVVFGTVDFGDGVVGNGLPLAQGVIKDGRYGGELADDAGGLHFLQAAVSPFGKVVRHDFGGFNIADGIA